TVAWTEALSTRGDPTVTPSSPPRRRTSPRVTVVPTSPSSPPSRTTSPGWTRSCLPPAFTIAYTVYSPPEEIRETPDVTTRHTAASNPEGDGRDCAPRS